MIKELIDTAMRERCGLDLHGIFEMDKLDGLNVKEACNQRGLHVTEVISFGGSDDSISAEYVTQSGAGFTTLVSVMGVEKPVIFVQKVLIEHSGINDLSRYGIILHELGHADDMIRGGNYRKGQPVDLAKVEAYAEVFCLRRLNKAKDEISELVRNMFAKRLVSMNGQSPLKTAIYKEAVSQMSRGKLATWAAKAPKEFTLT